MTPERIYRVGTFYNPEHRSGCRVTAYTRDYNPTWSGCVVYEIFAISGKNAKIAAIEMRKQHEGLSPVSEEGDQ